MVINLYMSSGQVKTNTEEYLKRLDHDIHNKGKDICGRLADKLGIMKSTPYKDEILNNPCEQTALELIMGVAYKQRDLKFTPEISRLIMKEGIFNQGTANIFETLVRIIIFSPIDSKSIVDQLFILLARLDLSPNPHKVKRTHVEFLIWYILRVAQIYLPYYEIVSQVYTMLNESSSHVISASITDLDNPRNPSLDVTELLNLWFVSQRRRTGTATIKLGNKGSLSNLAIAISFLQRERRLADHKFSKINKLRVLLKCKGVARKMDIKFDFNMNVISECKEIKNIENEIVLTLQDSEESLDLGQFSQVMGRFQILDWIFTRLTGIGNDYQTKREARNVRRSALLNGKEFNVVVKFRFNKGNGEQELGIVRLVKQKGTKQLDLKRDKTKLNYLIDNKAKLSFGTDIVSLTDYDILTGKMTVRGFIEESLKELQNELVRATDINKNTYKYTNVSLDLLGATFDNMSLFVEGRQLNPEYFYVTLEALSERLENPKKIHVLVEFNKTDLKPVYNHWAKDIFYLEGVDVVDNPLVPCQVLSTDDIFAELIFINNSGRSVITLEKRKVPLEDTILTQE